MEQTWQVELSSKSVKKNQKYKVINLIIPLSEGNLCLEIGAETGVVTDYLRRNKGGTWIAGTLGQKWYDTCLEFLKKDVAKIDPQAVNFKDSVFDLVLASRPEHIKNDKEFFKEVQRILKPGGELFILTPHKSPSLFLNIWKEKLGLGLEQYDHYRPGYSVEELKEILEKRGFEIIKSGTYCKFFSELIELTLNAGYAFFNRASYRPSSQEEVSKNKLGFTIYKFLFPILALISKLDYLLFFSQGYVLYLQARKV